MAYNSTVTLIGNTGKEAQIIQTEDKTFATLSVATTDNYKDKEGNWKNKETLWHNVLVFNPTLVEAVQNFPKGTRLKIIGSLSYRDFQISGEDGNPITKREASIVAGKIEEAPLTKKEVA